MVSGRPACTTEQLWLALHNDPQAHTCLIYWSVMTFELGGALAARSRSELDVLKDISVEMNEDRTMQQEEQLCYQPGPAH